MTDRLENESCQNPSCDDEAVRTYVDCNGNELELCETDYYSAVHPRAGPRVSVSKAIGNDDEGSLIRRMFT